jgi:isopentenyl diphosphate isomerase/L-lactate dehydrogenase-like FMN-dependent dehydrogenase
VVGRRRDERNGLAGFLAELVAASGRPALGNFPDLDDPSALLDPTLSWDDVAELARRWDGPVLVKGVLHPADVEPALEAGAAGIVVSNHGGRQLDRVVASLDALPDVVEAVAGRVPVLVDGGVRCGLDVVTALALGAAACLVGRPHMYAAAVGGEAGVTRMLEWLRADLAEALLLLGRRGVGDLTRDCVQPARKSERPAHRAGGAHDRGGVGAPLAR